MSNKLTLALTLALGLSVPSLAHASFIGNTVTGEHLGPTTANVFETSSALVGAGVEFTMLTGLLAGGVYAVDVSDTSLLFDLLANGTLGAMTFNGFHLSDTNGTIDTITGVSITGNNWVGFDASRITFDADNIWVNMQGLSTASTDSLSLDVAFDTVQPPNPNPTPEPATLALLGLGLLGLGALRRKA
jgi:hypothetical protein